MKNTTLSPLKSKVDVSELSFIQKPFEIGILTPLKTESLSDFVKTITMACELGFHFSILLSGGRDFQTAVLDLSEKFPQNIKIFESSSQNTVEILKKSQSIFFLEMPEVSALKIILGKGLVPIMPSNTMLRNFDAVEEIGEAFCFNGSHPVEIFAVMVRAYENYKFVYDWNNLKKRMKKKLLVI